ncbi:MAG TPA: hypothetical protein DEA96_09380, partial [Leptospiraceae bacterium]|nr:hypothetical protein [Leptospiraceae bacterium]
MVLDFRRIKERGWSFRLTWDLFMIFVAVVNLIMILFDLTYFIFRPQYRSAVPELVQFYDPYKGVESNPEFEAYISLGSNYFEEEDGQQTRYRNELTDLSRELGNTYREFFEETGQWQSIRSMTSRMHDSLPESSQVFSTRQYRLQDVGPLFWQELEPSEQKPIFDSTIRPTFDRIYYRHREIDGSFVDRFILFDAPFLILF